MGLVLTSATKGVGLAEGLLSQHSQKMPHLSRSNSQNLHRQMGCEQMGTVKGHFWLLMGFEDLQESQPLKKV
jgi:deoxyxylulose-5-phosphate synthase